MYRRHSSKYGKRNKWWKLLSYNEFCHPIFMKRHSVCKRKRKLYKRRRIFQRKSYPIPKKLYWPVRKKYPAGVVLPSYTDFKNSFILDKDPVYVRDPIPKKIIPLEKDTNCLENVAPVIKISSFYQNENTVIRTVPFNADSYEPEQKGVCNTICKEKRKHLFSKLFKRTKPKQKMFTGPSMTQEPLKYSFISKRKSNTILSDPFTPDSRLKKFYVNRSNVKKKCTKNENKTKLNRYKGVCKRKLPIHLNKSINNEPVLPFINTFDLDDHRERDKYGFVVKNKSELSFSDFKQMNERELRIIMSELTQVISGFKVRRCNSFNEDDTCSNKERMIYYNNTDDLDCFQSSLYITSESELEKEACRGIKFFIKPKVSFSKKWKSNFRKKLKLT